MTNCPYCQLPITSLDHFVTCPECNALHHAQCWQETGKRCSIHNCRGAGDRVAFQLDAGATTSHPSQTATPRGSTTVKSISGVARLPERIRREMIAEARKEYPIMACGLLEGNGWSASGFRPMTNVEHSPLQFRIDGRELLNAFDDMDRNGRELVGVFMCHTHSAARPARTTIELWGYPYALCFIVSLANQQNPDLRAFTIIDRQVNEVPIQIV